MPSQSHEMHIYVIPTDAESGNFNMMAVSYMRVLFNFCLLAYSLSVSFFYSNVVIYPQAFSGPYPDNTSFNYGRPPTR